MDRGRDCGGGVLWLTWSAGPQPLDCRGTRADLQGLYGLVRKTVPNFGSPEVPDLVQGKYASVDDPFAELVTERSADRCHFSPNRSFSHQVGQSRCRSLQRFSTHGYVQFVHRFAIVPTSSSNSSSDRCTTTSLSCHAFGPPSSTQISVPLKSPLIGHNMRIFRQHLRRDRHRVLI